MRKEIEKMEEKKRTAKKKLREFFLQHVSWLGILHLSTLF